MQIRLASYQFTLDEPFAAGHQLTAGEAQALNGLRAENIRNNFMRQHFSALIADQEGQLLSAEQLAVAQQWLDAYANSYSFGQRRAIVRKGAIELAAEEVAKEQALEQAAASGRSLSLSELAEAIQQLLALDSVQQEARERVAERKQIAESALEDLL